MFVVCDAKRNDLKGRIEKAAIIDSLDTRPTTRTATHLPSIKYVVLGSGSSISRKA